MLLTDRLGEKEAWRPTHFSKYQTFFCIFPMNYTMATLGLKEMGKFLWEGMEKSLPTWLSQFSFAKLRQKQSRLFSLPSQRISFKPKEAIDEFFWKTQRKIWYSILRVDAMPFSLKKLLIIGMRHEGKNFGILLP